MSSAFLLSRATIAIYQTDFDGISCRPRLLYDACGKVCFPRFLLVFVLLCWLESSSARAWAQGSGVCVCGFFASIDAAFLKEYSACFSLFSSAGNGVYY